MGAFAALKYAADLVEPVAYGGRYASLGVGVLAAVAVKAEGGAAVYGDRSRVLAPGRIAGLGGLWHGDFSPNPQRGFSRFSRISI